jgi:hypothetical protein
VTSNYTLDFDCVEVFYLAVPGTTNLFMFIHAYLEQAAQLLIFGRDARNDPKAAQ